MHVSSPAVSRHHVCQHDVLMFLAASPAQTRPIATDVARIVVCLSVCMLGVTRLNYAKTAEAIEIPSEELTHMGSKNHVLDGVQMDEYIYRREG